MFKFVFSLKRKTVEELDNLYEIIDDHNSWVEIRKKGDSSYWNETKTFEAYKFSDGVKRLCIDKGLRLCFTERDNVFSDLKSIYHYMKKMGCSDLILDTLVDTAKMSRNPNVKYKQRKKKLRFSRKINQKGKRLLSDLIVVVFVSIIIYKSHNLQSQ